MNIAFSAPSIPATGAYVVGVLDNRKLTPSAKQLDHKMRGRLMQAIKASRFKGDKGQSLTMLAPAGTKLDRVLVAGLGKAANVDSKVLQEVGGSIYATLGSVGLSRAVVAVDAIDGVDLEAPDMAADLALGARLRSYRFDKYRTKEKSSEKPSLKSLTVHCTAAPRAREAFAVMDRVADGVFFTRNLVSEPPNVLYPESLAQHAKSLSKLGVTVEVLNEKQMKRLGMGALLGVGQGSARESRLVIMQWKGATKRRSKGRRNAPVAFVGKGVTFDTGGISLKPSEGMQDMKYDMGGSGVVIGLMKALAGRKANIDAVGIIGLAENMPGGNAQRPSDVVTSMSGQTIEVLNTDAEGRLVLADALWYCNDRFKPKFIVDLATLTGAIIISLGNEYAGLFSNNDILSQRLTDAGKTVGEKLWRMPMGDTYDRLLKSQIADMPNIGGNRGAGSITAAQFLQRFVGKTPWAHLDIAGVTWVKEDQPLIPIGATGFGVRLLDRLVADYYEEK